MIPFKRLLLLALPPLLLTSFASTPVAALGQQQVVCFDWTEGAFPLVSSGPAAAILVSEEDSNGVKRAAATFAGDVANVTGQSPEVVHELAAFSNSSGSHVVLVGSVGSPFVTTLVNAGAMNVSDIEGRWESFKIEVVDGSALGVETALVVVGSDKRGTIYGVYDLSEQIGVSPWAWWADVRIPHQDEIYIKNEPYVHGSPTVKYRGFFLNDEQPALTNWAIQHYGTNSSVTFKHEFYEQIYELLLRLKANLFWPAMWSAYFALDDPQNQPLADDYGVIYSTSHQEPMARNTPEWNTLGTGPWNYTSNKAVLDAFWTEGIERAKPYETMITVGMRGNGDLPLPGANIPIVEDILKNQREIITNVTGKPASEVPQLWCLYKEVQGYWEQGLTAPDDIILLWTDDNWGNNRRVPSESERNRTGGAGLYSHFDYVGDPKNYKWLNTNSISKVWEQLSTALDFGIDQLYIVNVGDLKPMEAPINFYFEYAYDAPRWGKENLHEYLVLWAAREWGADHAEKIADVFERYMHYVSRQKPESATPTTYSLTSFHEADRVIKEWSTLCSDAWDVYNALDDAAKDSFFQIILHPVRAVATVTELYVTVGQNNMRAVQARQSTNTLAQKAIDLFQEDAKITREYHELNGGKWNHFMDQPHIGQWGWQQNMINTLPALNWVQGSESTLPGPMRIAVEGSLGVWPGDALYQCAQGYNCPPGSPPPLTPYTNGGSRWFDISNGASVDWSWVAAINETWVVLSCTEGTISASDSSSWEKRVEVSVPDWSVIPKGVHVVSVTINTTSSSPSNISPGAPMSYTFPVTVNHVAVPDNYTGFVETDGGVSFEAAHATRNTTVGETKWEVIPGYSPRTETGDALAMFPRMGANFSVGAGPRLEYDFYLFNNQTSGNVTVNVYMGPTLNYVPGRPLQYAVQIDEGAPQLVQPVPAAKDAGSNPPDWNDVVSFNGRISSTNHTLTSAAPGAHTLKFWGVEQGVVLEKIVVNTVTPDLVQKSYLGQPESWWAGSKM